APYILDRNVCGPLCRSGSAQSDSSGFMEGEQPECSGDLRTAPPHQSQCASTQHLQSRRPAIMGCDSWWWSRESGNSMDTVLYGPVQQQPEGGGTSSISVDQRSAQAACTSSSHILHCPAASTPAAGPCWTSQSHPTVGDALQSQASSSSFCSSTSCQNTVASLQSSCLAANLSHTHCHSSLHRSSTHEDKPHSKAPLSNRRRHSMPNVLMLSSLSTTTPNTFLPDSHHNFDAIKPLLPAPNNTQKPITNSFQFSSHNNISQHKQFMISSQPFPQGKSLLRDSDSSPSAFHSVSPSVSPMTKLLSTTNSGDNGWSGADRDAWPPKLHSQQPAQCAVKTTVGPVLAALQSYRHQLYRQELLSRHLQGLHDTMDPAGVTVVSSGSHRTQLAASVAAIRAAIQTEVDNMEQLLLAPALHHNLGPDGIISIVSQMVCLLHKQSELCMDLETLAISTQAHKSTQIYNLSENGKNSQPRDNQEINTQMNGLNEVNCDSPHGSNELGLTTGHNSESLSSEIHTETISSNIINNNTINISEDNNGNNISTSITSDYTSSVISSIIDHSSSISVTSIDNPQPISSSQPVIGTITTAAMHPPQPSLFNGKRNEDIILPTLENNLLPKVKEQVEALVSEQTQAMKEHLDQNSRDMKDIKAMIELLMKQQTNNS
ncbi:unnamed protein product, partial [Meganyctiphanes norvegica]